MFKIEKIILCSNNDELFTYNFNSGINFFKGKNDSGKTVFYYFIDYMFGSSDNISDKVWFKSTLNYSILEFMYRGISYSIKREINPEITFFKYKDEDWGDPIHLNEYREKLNTVFTIETDDLIKLRDFAEEDLTYRTFTIFNFLGERSLGKTVDFFEKGMDIQYSIKLPMILNYLFNNNLDRINKLKKELSNLEDEIEKLESSQNQYSFITNKINNLLLKLNIQIKYNGNNKNQICEEIQLLKNLEESNRKKQRKPISELESMFNDINDQIKYYENIIQDNRQIKIENENRKKLINEFSEIIAEKNDYEYLILPIKKILSDLDKSISFSKYITNRKTINKLKNQRKEIKDEILENEYRFDSYSLSEKANWIAIVEDAISEDISDKSIDLERIKNEAKKLKENIRLLQNSDNQTKINELSAVITKLYCSAEKKSDIITKDCSLNEFKIQYFKKGNTLQPQIIPNDDDSDYQNYYVGSLARFTIIQFCGYLAFLKLLIDENKFPIIPCFIIDHISKPFDDENKHAIGIILDEFYKMIDKDLIQIIFFDDEDYSNLSIMPDLSVNLVQENQTGFNPFFNPKEI